MDQIYVEILVERKRNGLAGFLKILFLILADLSFLLMFFIPAAIVAIAVFAGLSYFFHMNGQIEYEYSYVNRELSIDKIMAKSRRKHVADYPLDKIEIGAPESSYRLDAYRGRPCSVKDYSSGREGGRFVLYYEGSQKILLEADEALIKPLRSAAPSKIFAD